MLEPFCWQITEVGKAMEALVSAAGLPLRNVALPQFEPSQRWIESAGSVLGLETEMVDCSISDAVAGMQALRPGILALEDGNLLLVLEGGQGHVTLLGRDSQPAKVDSGQLAKAIAAQYSVELKLPAFLDGIPAAASLYHRAVETRREEEPKFATLMSFRVASNSDLVSELRYDGFARRLASVSAISLVQSAIAVAATLALGELALNGRIDSARIVGWTLAMALQSILQGSVGLRLGQLNLELGAILKRRLMDGSLLLDPDAVRRVGVGTNLATAAESTTIDQLSITDLIGIVTALATFVVALVFLLALDLFSGIAVLIMACAMCVSLAQYYRRSSRITNGRMVLTDTFVERVLGHQTRLVQLPRSRWHEGEDEKVHSYVEDARLLDRSQNVLSLIPSLTALLVALGQVRTLFDPAGRLSLTPLLAGYIASMAMASVAEAAKSVFRWPIALGVLLPILRHATTPQNWKALQPSRTQVADGETVLEGDNLHFSYAPERPPVLDGASLTIRANDKILMTGPSGGGKSTLAAILTALRAPTTGLVLLRGLDQHSIATSEWRRRVASAPQFHENYIFQNTLAFNLLMGREWPASVQDLRAAAKICEQLGLGDLLSRMPAGLHQMVGETGWRLSHGERSRVYIARALLQGADVLIFDESFGTLDPENLELAINTVRTEARTLLVISHT